VSTSTTDGVPGPFSTLPLSGPAADKTGEFNNNGIQSTADGSTLIVAHSAQGALNLVDPVTGTSSTVAGLSLESVRWLRARGAHFVRSAERSGADRPGPAERGLRSGRVTKVITSDLFAVPATVARFGDELAVTRCLPVWCQLFVRRSFRTGHPRLRCGYASDGRGRVALAVDQGHSGIFRPGG
jgi:hypothetical protein